MISLRDFLQRLRRAWAPPGPALARIAPPTDVSARLKDEIRPLLSAIAELQRSAALVRKEAEGKASGMVEEADRAADGKVREAEGSAPDARASAAKGRQDAVDAEIDRVRSASEKEVARIEATAGERMGKLVDQVAACVLSGAGIEP